MATDKPSLQYIWAESGTATKPDDAKIQAGYVAEKPYAVNFNWLIQRAELWMKHANENGIPVWDAVTDYAVGALTNVAGVLYRSLQTPNVNQAPASEAAYWQAVSLAAITPFVVGATGTYTTIQAAITAAAAVYASSGIEQLVYVQPGSYAENLLLADGVHLIGSGESATSLTGTQSFIGTAGVVNSSIANLNIASNSDVSALIIQSAADVTTFKVNHVKIVKSTGDTNSACVINITNEEGYGDIDLFNVEIRTGAGVACKSLSVSGNASVVCASCDIGSSSALGVVVIQANDACGVICTDCNVNGQVVAADFTYVSLTECAHNAQGVAALTIAENAYADTIDGMITCNQEPIVAGTGSFYYKNVGMPISRGFAATLNGGNVTMGRIHTEADPTLEQARALFYDIDAKTLGTTTLTTIPDSKSSVVYSILLIVASAVDITVPPTIRIGTEADDDVLVAPVQLEADMVAAGKTQLFTFVSDELVEYTDIILTVDVAATGTSMALKGILHQDIF